MILKALIGLALVLFEANCAIAEQVKLAVTSSFHNSGLSDHLIPHAEADLEKLLGVREYILSETNNTSSLRSAGLMLISCLIRLICFSA